MPIVAKNPILPGFYPDPSICAVGEDYYIVNSSFAYFPGLPIMHSTDLAHWEQIGNVLDRESQLPLGDSEISRGLFAPTIRYYNGTFYVICTNVSYGGNFIVTATDPKGPWSEPHYIKDADGIDPSLFFDEDGKCYYIGTHPNPDGCRYDGDWFIYIRELDIEKFEFVGEAKNVWNGAMKGVHWPEGPHLYHIGEYYYIIHAEGGTGPEHAVSVARSREVFGPYENNFCNPIFTHRHLGERYPIKYVGHADLFQAANGDWYMIMLAVRPTLGFTTMGRETFLARVIWEKDWPVVNPGLGILSPEVLVNLPESVPTEPFTSRPGVSKLYDFTQGAPLGPEFLFIRNPREDMYRCCEGDGLHLTCSKDRINSFGKPSFIGLRQDSKLFETTVTLKTDGLVDGYCAGIVLYQNQNDNLRIEYGGCHATVIFTRKGVEEKIGSVMLPANLVTLVISVVGIRASVAAVVGQNIQIIAKDLDISDLSTEKAGGFVGNTLGFYAQCLEDCTEEREAVIRSFSYKIIVPQDRPASDKDKEDENSDSKNTEE